MRVVENTPERLVLRERATGLYGIFLGISGGFLWVAANGLRQGSWEGALFITAITASVAFSLLKTTPFAIFLSFDKRQGTFEIIDRYIAFGERRRVRRVIPLAEITSVELTSVTYNLGSDDTGTSCALRVSLRSGEPVILVEGGIGNFPEKVRQICRFLELPFEEEPTSPWLSPLPTHVLLWVLVSFLLFVGGFLYFALHDVVNIWTR